MPVGEEGTARTEYKPAMRRTTSSTTDPAIHERQMIAASAPTTIRISSRMNIHATGNAEFMRHLPVDRCWVGLVAAALARAATPGRSVPETVRQWKALPARPQDIAQLRR